MPQAPAAPLPAALRALLKHFRAQRPLRAGSLLVTIFGDAIAPRGGAVTLESLIGLAAPFGVTERLVRTSVARLAREGWLSAVRSGRRSEYRLSSQGAERFAQATQRIYGTTAARWDGRWTLIVLPVGRPHAVRLREELRWLGFGQLSASLFAHPSTSAAEAREWLQGISGGERCLLLRSEPADAASERQLAAQGWDLKELERRYRMFIERFGPLEAQLQGANPAGEAAFLVRTLLIHEYRKIHLKDPLLPPTLLPPDWIGTRAYELARRIYALVFAAAEGHLSAAARTLAAPLPPAQAGAYARFGGIARR